MSGNPVAATSSSSVSAEAGRTPLKWRIAGTLTLLTTCAYMDRGVLSVAAPLIRRDLGISATGMGFVLAVFIWPYMALLLPSGWLADRFGPRRTMSIAVFCWSLVSLLTGFAGSLSQFIGVRALLGVAEAPLLPTAFKAATKWFPRQQLAMATSIYLSGSQIGLAVAPPLATVLVLVLGWQMMFVVVGLLGLGVLLVWRLVYRDPGAHPWRPPRRSRSCKQIGRRSRQHRRHR